MEKKRYIEGIKDGEIHEDKLLIYFTPTPPPLLNCNRGNLTLCLTWGSPGSYVLWEWKISPFRILRLGCAALRCHWYLSNICLY